MIIINFKNYKSGYKALKLAKIVEKYLPKAIVAVSAFDLGFIVNYTKLRVYAQHIDDVEGNRGTGFLNSWALKSCGGTGSLLNHSEHRIPIKVIKKILSNSKKFNLKIIVCASNLKEAKKIAKINQRPYAIAFEDSKLVGTGKSITKYKSEDIIKFVKLIKNTKIIPFCGAGINSTEDFKEAFRLGCKGVLISSAITNVKNPSLMLKQLRMFQ